MLKKIKKFKKWIITALIGGAVVAGGLSTLPRSEPMTYQEYQDYIEMMNYEVKRMDGRIENVNSKKDLIKKLNDRALNRRIKKKKRMHGREYSKKEYKNKRRELINKSERALR